VLAEPSKNASIAALLANTNVFSLKQKAQGMAHSKVRITQSEMSIICTIIYFKVYKTTL